jgi:hypothetical protein
LKKARKPDQGIVELGCKVKPIFSDANNGVEESCRESSSTIKTIVRKGF